MTRDRYRLVSIGNGVYARTRSSESLLTNYRKLQATCEHLERDAQGTCYRCGKREAKRHDDSMDR